MLYVHHYLYLLFFGCSSNCPKDLFIQSTIHDLAPQSHARSMKLAQTTISESASIIAIVSVLEVFWK